MASNQCVSASPVYSFKSQPVDGDPAPLSIVIVGDLGVSSIHGRETVKALTKITDETDLYLHVGDVSYADDFFDEIPDASEYEQRWNEFQTAIEHITTSKFYMTGAGNHEVTCIQGSDKKQCFDERNDALRNFSAYLHRFRMPGDESNGFKNLWYSFNFGLVHFVIITSETDFTDAPAGPNTPLNGGNFRPPGNQTNWLKDDLEKANKNRKTVPWIVVLAHRPFFGSVPGLKNATVDQRNCNSCRQAFARILEEYNVDFYFCGHIHWYERLFPVNSTGHAIANNYQYQNGTIYITSGAGGAPEGIQHALKRVPASAMLKSEYGYVNLKIQNATHCELFYIRTFDPKENNTLDSIKIARNHSYIHSLDD